MGAINNKIKEFRKANNWTQTYMAQRMGISQGAYSQLETGDTDSMRVSTLRKICEEFGIDPTWLLGLGEEETRTRQLYTKARNEIYRASKTIDNGNMTAEQKAALLQQLQHLMDELK